MKRFNWNWIVMILLLVLVLPAVGCRIPNVDTDADVAQEGDDQAEPAKEEPTQVAQAEPEAEPEAAPKAEPEIEPVAEDEVAGPPAPPKPAPAVLAPEEGVVSGDVRVTGKEVPKPVRNMVMKDGVLVRERPDQEYTEDVHLLLGYLPPNNERNKFDLFIEIYLWEPGMPVRLKGYYKIDKDGQRYWQKSRGHVVMFISNLYEVSRMAVGRPDGSQFCSGDFAQMVDIECTRIVRNGQDFYVASLDVPYHNCGERQDDGHITKAESVICGATVWELLEKGLEVTFFLQDFSGDKVKSSKGGKLAAPRAGARDYCIPFGQQSVHGHDIVEPSTGQVKTTIWTVYYDSETDIECSIRLVTKGKDAGTALAVLQKANFKNE